MMLFLGLHYSLGSVFLTLTLVSLSTLVNSILALLIILRPVHHQRHIRKVFGMSLFKGYHDVCRIFGIDCDSTVA